MNNPREPPQDGIYLVFTDAVRGGLKDWISSGRDYTKLPTPQAYITKALLETLRDPAVRREVYEAVRDGEQLSMMDVHTVMDGLVSVLYPHTTEDPTTTEEQDRGSNSKEADADEL
jgi:hypothetical protein